MRLFECVQCHKESEPTDVWLPGWGCLYGNLAVCSRECAEAFAATTVYGSLREGDLDMEPGDTGTVGRIE